MSKGNTAFCNPLRFILQYPSYCFVVHDSNTVSGKKLPSDKKVKVTEKKITTAL